MRAWQIDHHGGPEVIQRIEIPGFQPAPMTALVEVEAVGLNHLDLWVRNGVEGHTFPLPIIPGCDVTGKVIAWGQGAQKQAQKSGIDLGSAIVVNPGLSCGQCEACLTGFDPLCKSYGILGETQNGGCADQIQVPLANLILRPKNITAIQAAALPIAYLTAWTMLTRKAGLKPGEHILIQAGGSGVSVAAIQMAKLLGATVITTVGSDEKIQKTHELGADYVIQYKKVSFREEVKRILSHTRKKGCEVVLDHVGTDTFEESLKCLSWGGRLVVCGATSGSKVEIDLKPVFFKNLSILGSTMGSKGDLIRVIDLVASGKLKAVIDSVYPMDELPQAMTHLESRKGFGKVVLSR